MRTTLTWFREWLDGLASARPEAQDIYLLGFSAGMAMAGALTLDEPERYAGVVLLSGTLPFETDVPFTKDRLKGVPIYHGHGSFDRVIPADLVARTAKFLRETGGAALTSRTFPIAHEISEAEIVDVNAALTRWMES